MADPYPPTQPPAEPGLGEVLWRGRWLVAVAISMSLAIAIFSVVRAERVYEATALLRIDESSAPGSGAGDAFNAQQVSQSLAATYAAVLQSPSFLERIAPRVAKGGMTPSELDGRVRAEAVEDTALISLTVLSASPRDAERLASDVAQAFVGSLNEDTRRQLNEQQEEIEARIEGLSAQIQRGEVPGGTGGERLSSLRGARDALTQQLADVLGNEIARSGAVSLAGPPQGLSTPVRPRPLLSAVVAVLVGSLIGVALAWGRARLDTRLRSSEEAAELLRVEVLGSIPLLRRWSPQERAVRGAFDMLHANLVLRPLGQGVRVLTITSHNPREGKTSVTYGLAEAAARAGSRVVVVDGDLRTRRLSTLLRLLDAPGLTHSVDGFETLWIHSGDQNDLPFDAVPAGEQPSDPTALLHSPRLASRIALLRENYDLVVIDAPATGNLADATIFAAHSEAAVIVARVGATTRADLRSVAETLAQQMVPIRGLVVIEPRRHEHYYPDASSEQQRAPTALPR